MGDKISFYESMGGGGGVTNMISISFSGIKMFWLVYTPPPFSFIFNRWCPISTTHRRKEKYAYADVQQQSNSFAAINAHRRN